MDFETQRKKRMEELEIKRKRLEEMKKAKDKNSATSTEVPSPKPVLTDAISQPDKSRADLDDLVNSLLAPSSNEVKADEENHIEPATIVHTIPIKPKVVQELTTMKGMATFSILPSRVETYEKEIQTDEVIVTDTLNEENDIREEQFIRKPQEATPIKSPNKSKLNLDNDIGIDAQPFTRESSLKKYTPTELQNILGNENFKSFIKSSSRSVHRALAQSSSIDILQDYTNENSGATFRNDENQQAMTRVKGYQCRVIEGRPVMDVQFSPHHAELFLIAYGAQTTENDTTNHADRGSIASASTSARGNVSLSQSSNASSGVETWTCAGVVCIWSIISDTTPEFVFISSSPVLTARFHPEDPHLIIGACYNGQVVMWDMRSPSSRPCQHSSTSGKGHKHPVYSLCVSKATLSSSVFISASTDGTFCQWDYTNLTEPTSVITLTAPNQISLNASNQYTLSGTSQSEQVSTSAKSAAAKDIPIYASCMVLGPDEESRKVLIGSEVGVLYKVSLPFQANGAVNQVQAHFGYITSMSLNPTPLSAFRKLLLTASIDWSIKLWNVVDDDLGHRPLLQFNAAAFDYFCGVSWCPINCGEFVSATSGGLLMLWNIAKSVVEPISSIKIQSSTQESESKQGREAGGTSSSSTGSKEASVVSARHHSVALNKVIWTEDGRKVVVGDSFGMAHMVVVKPSFVEVRSGDEDTVEKAIQSGISEISTMSLIHVNTAEEGVMEEKSSNKKTNEI